MSNEASQVKRKVRWAIVGTGNVAWQFAEGLSLVDDAELVAVSSRTESRARQMGRAFGGAKGYGDYGAMLRESGCDVVYVATPHHRHAEDCLMAIEAGKGVLCEKPFTVDAGEAERVIAAARARGVFCMEAMWTRFIPAMRRAVEMLRVGEIGDMRVLTGDFAVPMRFDPASRYFDPKMGGGALLDRGVYLVSLAQQLFGDPLAVSATMTQTPTGVDDHVTMTLSYRKGRSAVLVASIGAYGTNEAVVLGTNGRLVIGEPMCRPDGFMVQHMGPQMGDGGVGRPGMVGRLKQKLRSNRMLRRVRRMLRRGHEVGMVGNGYNYEAAEVTRCIAAGKLESDVMPLDETLAVMRTMDELRQGARKFSKD
jgi:predicted dehydrogenase